MDLQKQTPEETFDLFTAVGIAEGFLDCESEERKIAAWQHLVDTNAIHSLQGWFGRTATAMINKGLLKPKSNGH